MPRPFYSLLLVLASALFAVSQAAQTPQPTAPDITVKTIEPVHPAPPPENASASELESTGDHLRMAKAYNDAIDYYETALKKEPQSAGLYNKIGIAELQLLHYSLAQKDFEHAIKLNRSFPEPVNNLGATYYARRKYGKAIKLYQKAIRMRDGSAPFHSNLGVAYFAKKEYAKAGPEFARAMQLDPEIFERQSAAGIGVRLISPEDRARFSYVMAKLYAERGAYDLSITYLKKAVEGGYSGVSQALQDKEFGQLRKDPHFGKEFAQVMAAREPVTN
jgi:tetratricopeptide (TPR) repeat protein